MKKTLLSALVLVSGLASAQDVARVQMCTFAAEVVSITVAARSQGLELPAITALVQHRLGGSPRADRSAAYGVELAYRQVPESVNAAVARHRLLEHCSAGLPGAVRW